MSPLLFARKTGRNSGEKGQEFRKFSAQGSTEARTADFEDCADGHRKGPGGFGGSWLPQVEGDRPPKTPDPIIPPAKLLNTMCTRTKQPRCARQGGGPIKSRILWCFWEIAEVCWTWLATCFAPLTSSSAALEVRRVACGGAARGGRDFLSSSLHRRSTHEVLKRLQVAQSSCPFRFVPGDRIFLRRAGNSQGRFQSGPGRSDYDSRIGAGARASRV